MAGENDWQASIETDISKLSLEDSRIAYNTTREKINLTVYELDGVVNKYWNVGVLPDELGYVRLACPRDGKVLWFNWFKWSAYYFVHTGHTELVLMPRARGKTMLSLSN